MTDIDKKDKFFIITGKELQKHGYTIVNRPVIKLNLNEVPTKLRPLIPLAEYWGVNDDIIRYDLIKQSSIESLVELVETIGKPQIEDELDKWLAGPEADREELSIAYITFTAMRLAAEEGQALLSKLNRLQ